MSKHQTPRKRTTPDANEQPAQQSQIEGEALSLDPAEVLSAWERTKYVAGTALSVGGVAELIGFGGFSFLLAAVGGVAGFVFSEEMRNFLLDHAPAPKAARRSRAARLEWWLTGEVPAETEEAEAAGDGDEDGDLDDEDDEDPLHDVPNRGGSQPGPATGSAPARRNQLAPRQEDPPPDYVQLAPDLARPVDEIAGKAIFVVGMRRSGKTTLGVRIVEELAGHYIPLFWPDLEGDCLSMVDMLPRGRIAGHPDSFDPESEYAYAFEPVTLDNAALLGYSILEEGWQVVLDMASYESIDEACQVTVRVIRGLFAWADDHPKKRVPCLVGLDEAQRFLPERLSDSIISDKVTLEQLLKAYMDIIAVGGKRGLAPLILTQRFAQVNKKIMAQSELFFILRQTMDKDLERCMEYVKRSTATEEDISRFQQGEGVYIGLGGEQFVTHFYKRHSDGSRSHTPTAEAARRYAQMPLSRPGTRGAQQTPKEQAAAEPPAQGIPAPQPPAPRGPSLLERGVTAYLDGATSQPKLAAALGITPWEVRTLMPQVQAEVQRRQSAQGEPDSDED